MNLKTILNHKVVKAGGWYTVTEFFIKGIGFLTIPIFTRLLTPEDYGIATLYLTWVSIFTIIVSLNLNTTFNKGKFDFKEDYNQLVSSTMMLSLIVFFIYVALFVIFNDFFTNLTGLTQGLFYLMIIQAYFSFVKTSIITKFRVEYKYKLISIISMIIAIGGIILSIFLITNFFEEQRYLGKIIGGAVLIVIAGPVFLYYLLSVGRVYLNFKYWKYALFLSVPLIIHSLSGVLNVQFDRIVINKYVGDAAVGIYSFAYSIGMMISVLIHSLNQAWTPWVFEKMNEKKYTLIKSRGANYRDFVTLVYAGILLLSPEIIKVMADQRYWEGIQIIPWVFMAYYFSYMYTLEVNVELYYKKTGLISIGTLISALINIILNFIFVPIYGYMAAAVTTTISYLLLFIFHYLLTSKVIKHRVYGLKFHLVSFGYLIVINLYFILFIDFMLMRIIGCFIFLLLFYLKFRNIKN